MRWGTARLRRERSFALRSFPRDRRAARAAARRSASGDPLAIGRSSATPTLAYSSRSGHWWLWWPCSECGDVRLPLRGSAGGRAPVYVLRAAAAAEGCPGCETRRRRGRDTGPEPSVWYDTQLRDWVVRLGGEAILPLELRWFDLPQAVVYRAASDIAYLGDAFDGGLPDDPRQRGDQPS